MSRIGKLPITVPAGVEVHLEAQLIRIKGKKGELSFTFQPSVSVAHEGNQIIVKRKNDTPESRAFHGLTRSIIQNMVTGVSEGFEKRLEIIGVGYRAQISGKKLTLNLGFSHPVEMEAPEGIDMEMDKDQKNVLIIRGYDKQVVGEFAANIRKFRPPEPYKGKGVRYVGEYVARKAGKTAAKE